MTDFQEAFFLITLKKNQNGQLKKLRFSTAPILNIFFQKLYGLVLGLVESIDANGLKTPKMHFLPVFELMLD